MGACLVLPPGAQYSLVLWSGSRSKVTLSCSVSGSCRQLRDRRDLVQTWDCFILLESFLFNFFFLREFSNQLFWAVVFLVCTIFCKCWAQGNQMQYAWTWCNGSRARSLETADWFQTSSTFTPFCPSHVPYSQVRSPLQGISTSELSCGHAYHLCSPGLPGLLLPMGIPICPPASGRIPHGWCAPGLCSLVGAGQMIKAGWIL